MSGALVAALSAGAAVLLVRPVLATRGFGAARSITPAIPAAALRRRKARQRLVAGMAGCGAWLFVGGPLGPAAGVVAAVVAAVVLSRQEDPAVRRYRLAAEADLPHLVLLLSSALRSGAPPVEALTIGCAALPGAAADRLSRVRARLALGVDPVEVWAPLTNDDVLAPLARTMARAARSGAPVAAAVDRLADDLARQRRGRQEERARTVGVRAALPLGFCLLPAFLLIGIVPVVAGLFTELTR